MHNKSIISALAVVFALGGCAGMNQTQQGTALKVRCLAPVRAP